MQTPKGNRLHIGIYGRRNAGKSTLINALTGQQTAIVSDTPGTTADPVYKSMELRPIGPVIFIDTAGYDDEGELGELRVKKTEATLAKADIAILVIYGHGCGQTDAVENKADAVENKADEEWIEKLRTMDIPFVIFDSRDLEGTNRDESIEKLRGKVAELAASVGLNEDAIRRAVIERLVPPGGLVLLVMPQDISAPKGRLILPQVQTLRELLDRGCTSVMSTADGFESALKSLGRDPDIIITDSQCFAEVYDAKPENSALTSFSVLFAEYKGDIDTFMAGAQALDDIAAKAASAAKPGDDAVTGVRVLIAEACAHVPANEDIGTVKIPRGLKKYFEKSAGKKAADNLEIVNVCGSDFPELEELKKFDLVIHCGACMFNRRHVLSRIAECRAAGVPISNYGIILAKITGIIDKIMV